MRKTKRNQRIDYLTSVLEQDLLIGETTTEINYINPKRKGQPFYTFCNSYARTSGMILSEEQIGYLRWKKRQIQDLKDALDSSERKNLTELIRLLGTPLDIIFIPIIGIEGRCTTLAETIKIELSKYPALLDLLWSSKPHEYLHAYDRIVKWDLWKRGIIGMERYFCDSGEPGVRIPNHVELKTWEREVLTRMINQEETI